MGLRTNVLRHLSRQRIRLSCDLRAGRDAAVLAAYGWTDFSTACDFILDYEDGEEGEGTSEEGTNPSHIPVPPSRASRRKRPWRYRWPDDIRDEVLARLLKLNAERAKEEQLAGMAAAAAAPAKTKRRKGEQGKRGAGAGSAQGDLLPPPQKDMFG